ncbi:agmatine deiminase [Butyrivibrio sp. LC3010]|uniref:agmatine deiminase n=1 Tax=Butyrivibrio sp. LC3010 TaxID=1280680 RepID=UPI00042542A4|nr:agmatine deiminase [Butyrivibrio sp. LC3010]
MNKKLNGIPINDGFSMPAEYDIHDGTLMIWPSRPGSWGKDSTEARLAFCSIFSEIIKSEKLYVLCSSDDFESAGNFIRQNVKGLDKIITVREADKETGILQADILKETNESETGIICLIEQQTDDSWARDVGPTFLRNPSGEIRGIDWEFNAWGGDYDGLYSSWEYDDKVAADFSALIGKAYYDAHPFVLEGGSIHSDGEGTVMVTESCLLSKGRNPKLTKQQIEESIKNYLGVEKVLWLPFGIYNDETNEHVDNVCAFIAPGEVVLAWTDNKDDPQYEMSLKDYEYLSGVTDARGRKLKIHKLYIPDVPVCCTKEDIDNYVFEDGEDEREVGERLAASYVNFYFTNTEVLIPAFGGENKESDDRAMQLLSEICKNRTVVQIKARPILLGGGNIHCITQQIPSKISNMHRKVIHFE